MADEHADQMLQSLSEDECLRISSPMTGDPHPIHGWGSDCYLAVDDGRIVKRRVTDVGRWHSLQIGKSHAEQLIEEGDGVEVVSRNEWPENEGEFEHPDDGQHRKS